ncbi:uncharacterized protein L969DRAFT_71183 [Mixia osmundae IAM 14324]|uniref:Fork-head domain-containing protein n=1 Tax=Mixia osmundae (strain CBS 9802 / IAM 14324 / JCM 22182 / KY 12970) TaxID=764103 RepID=G7DYI5_MIXOS|nr:uncharacterized protein L969DRAFT_71183 [Mixia osmundae IAM 14324]KEI41546.1 hypothetical protein L969DRAFT_71183 [Mixia osmundae IAM 14324]GAA95645.1 hypothetical protein E5Q_02301 [Mixia osmundae IAM 14324]
MAAPDAEYGVYRILEAGVQGLSQFVHERKLVREAPLASLKDARLGIDADHYIRGLLDASRAREPFVAAIGGAPQALISQFEQELRLLEMHKIKPVFVFSGVPYLGKERPFAKDNVRAQKRFQGWAGWEKSNADLAKQMFSESDSILAPNVLRLIFRLFKQRHVEYIVAPYAATAQLVYLERHQKGYVNALWGTTDLFLYDIDRIILDMDLKGDTFTFVSRASICEALQLTADQLLDFCILVGSEVSRPFPVLAPDAPFRQAHDFMRQYRSGTSIVMSFADHPLVRAENYLDLFCRAQTLVRHALVLSAEEGRVMPIGMARIPPAPLPPPTGADVPSDLHEVFSHRLPDELYYHMCRGLITAPPLAVLTDGAWPEPVPLCGGETDDYKRFVKDYLMESPQGPRCVSLALLTSVLNSYWSKKPLMAVYYFNPKGSPIPHNSRETVAIVDRTAGWNVNMSVIDDELRRQSSSTIDILLCLGATSTNSLAARTKTSPGEKPLDKKDEIVANVLWRFLEMRSLLTSSHQHTPYAKALLASLKLAKVNDKFQEPLYLAIELIRANVLHGGKYGGRTWSGGPIATTEAEKRNMLLFMRSVSIVPMSYLNESYRAQLSRELIVFNSFLTAMSRSLRTMIECTVVHLLLHGDGKRVRDDFLEISLSLPFQCDTSTGTGIMLKGYVDAVTKIASLQGVDTASFRVPKTGSKGDLTYDESDAGKSIKDQVKSMLVANFTTVKNVTAELDRAFRFWHCLLQAVTVLNEEKVIPKELYEHADFARHVSTRPGFARLPLPRACSPVWQPRRIYRSHTIAQLALEAAMTTTHQLTLPSGFGHADLPLDRVKSPTSSQRDQVKAVFAMQESNQTTDEAEGPFLPEDEVFVPIDGSTEDAGSEEDEGEAMDEVDQMRTPSLVHSTRASRSTRQAGYSSSSCPPSSALAGQHDRARRAMLTSSSPMVQTPLQHQNHPQARPDVPSYPGHEPSAQSKETKTFQFPAAHYQPTHMLARNQPAPRATTPMPSLADGTDLEENVFDSMRAPAMRGPAPSANSLIKSNTSAETGEPSALERALQMGLSVEQYQQAKERITRFLAGDGKKGVSPETNHSYSTNADVALQRAAATAHAVHGFARSSPSKPLGAAKHTHTKSKLSLSKSRPRRLDDELIHKGRLDSAFTLKSKNGQDDGVPTTPSFPRRTPLQAPGTAGTMDRLLSASQSHAQHEYEPDSDGEEADLVSELASMVTPQTVTHSAHASTSSDGQDVFALPRSTLGHKRTRSRTAPPEETASHRLTASHRAIPGSEARPSLETMGRSHTDCQLSSGHVHLTPGASMATPVGSTPRHLLKVQASESDIPSPLMAQIRQLNEQSYSPLRQMGDLSSPASRTLGSHYSSLHGSAHKRTVSQNEREGASYPGDLLSSSARMDHLLSHFNQVDRRQATFEQSSPGESYASTPVNCESSPVVAMISPTDKSNNMPSRKGKGSRRPESYEQSLAPQSSQTSHSSYSMSAKSSPESSYSEHLPPPKRQKGASSKAQQIVVSSGDAPAVARGNEVTGGRYGIPRQWPQGEERKQKPVFSYAALIGQAIFSTPNARMSLADIYSWIMSIYPYYKKGDAGWQNSIRHNLSLNDCFVKTVRGKDQPGKGCLWGIAAGTEEQFIDGGFFKRGPPVMKSARPKAPKASPAPLEVAIATNAEHSQCVPAFVASSSSPQLSRPSPELSRSSADKQNKRSKQLKSGVLPTPSYASPPASLDHTARRSERYADDDDNAMRQKRARVFGRTQAEAISSPAVVSSPPSNVLGRMSYHRHRPSVGNDAASRVSLFLSPPTTPADLPAADQDCPTEHKEPTSPHPMMLPAHEIKPGPLARSSYARATSPSELPMRLPPVSPVAVNTHSPVSSVRGSTMMSNGYQASPGTNHYRQRTSSLRSPKPSSARFASTGFTPRLPSIASHMAENGGSSLRTPPRLGRSSFASPAKNRLLQSQKSSGQLQSITSTPAGLVKGYFATPDVAGVSAAAMGECGPNAYAHDPYDYGGQIECELERFGAITQASGHQGHSRSDSLSRPIYFPSPSQTTPRLQSHASFSPW